MPSRCSAPHCTNSSHAGYCSKSMPQDDQLRQEWVKAANSPGWNPPKTGRLCEVHFDSSNLFCLGSKKLLKSDAFPKYFCSCDREGNLVGSSTKRKANRTVAAISEHNYVFRPSETVESGKDEETKSKRRKLHHVPTCPILKPPVNVKVLREGRTVALSNETEPEQIVVDCDITPQQNEQSDIIQALRKEVTVANLELQRRKKENEQLKTKIAHLENELLHVRSFMPAVRVVYGVNQTVVKPKKVNC